MLKHFTAALAALFFLFPLSAVGESLDLSQLGAIEEAEHWEERAWYQREDGSDWRRAGKDRAIRRPPKGERGRRAPRARR